ncbi:DeoR/GlpR family DNA-binding transcription regulator [Microbacterium lacticum]
MDHRRQAEIVDLLLHDGYQSVSALAERFGVTASTIRRDLDQLERMELVERVHGGVNALRQADTPSRLKETLHHSEKVAIGRAMAERIQDGQTVLLDSGTTTLEVARALGRRRLTILTNDLRIGLEVANNTNAHLVFVGGELLPGVYTMWGPTAVEQISHVHVDVAVFGADTVSEDGVFNASSYEVELKRTMLGIARTAFLVADSSKFGREALFKVFDLGAFEAGITDDTLDPIRASQFPVPLIRVPVD